MSDVLLYDYKKWTSCRNAAKFLQNKKISFENKDIIENPPTKKELNQMIAIYDGDLRKVFNTAGAVFKELKLKDKIDKLNKKDAVDLLAKNGKLIKRPFLLTKKSGAVGFKEDQWKSLFS